MNLNQKNIILGISLFVTLWLGACSTITSVKFGSSRLNLESVKLGEQTNNLYYTNKEQGISVEVARKVAPNADSQLKSWIKLMLTEQDKFRGNPLKEKQLNNITYYEVIDAKSNDKFVYIFGTNQENNALLMKFAKFPGEGEVPSTFIQNLYQFKTL